MKRAREQGDLGWTWGATSEGSSPWQTQAQIDAEPSVHPGAEPDQRPRFEPCDGEILQRYDF